MDNEVYTTRPVEYRSKLTLLAGTIVVLMFSLPASYALGAMLFGNESLDSKKLRLESAYEAQVSIIERSTTQKQGLEVQIKDLEDTIEDATATKWSTELDLAKVKLQIELSKDDSNEKEVKRLTGKMYELEDTFDDVFTTEQVSQ